AAEAEKARLIREKEEETKRIIEEAEQKKAEIIDQYNRKMSESTKSWWDSIVSTIGGACQTAWNWVQNAFGQIADAVGGAVKAAGDWLSGFADAAGKALSDAGNAIWNFITSICFAHAIHDAVTLSLKDLDLWVAGVKESMKTGLEQVKGFVGGVKTVGLQTLEVGGVGVGAAAPAPIPAMAPVNVTITAPLVNIEGSADKATAELAARLVAEKLETVLVEASSSAAPTKRIRIMGGVL
ncbi:MAG: hypothetical protein QXH20_06865, partial [Candidatus Bathyarchaeia archaeon]